MAILKFEDSSLLSLLMLYLSFFSSFCCPYKDNNDIMENFQQTIKFSRNQQAEAEGLSFGFHFWIQNVYSRHKIPNDFHNPSFDDKEKAESVILSIDEEQVERFKIYSSYIDHCVYVLSSLGGNLEISLLPQTNLWQFIFLIFQPIDGKLLIQWESQVITFPFYLVDQTLNINFGAIKNVNDALILNYFRGRLTHLKTIEYFSYYVRAYYDYKNFCIIPQKFINSFGDYNLSELSCEIGCKECLKTTGECLVLDSDFIGYQYNYFLLTMGCELSYIQIPFTIKDQNFFICAEFELLFPYIQLIEVPKLPEFRCEFGYFLVYKNNNDHFCIQCPYQTNKTQIIECIDCLEQNKIWFREPICKSDIIIVNNSSTSSNIFMERSVNDYTVFIIDDLNHLVPLIGVKKFCQEDEIEKCFKLGQKHLGKIVYVECKNGYYFKEGNCVFLQKKNSQLVLKEFWNQCKFGSYLLNGFCVKCPQLCEICTFNEKTSSAICLQCIKSAAIINNQCQQCGSFCIECIEEYDQISNNQFLRCLRCLDDSQYYVSFDAVNCLENSISNCMYAFQVLKDNITISTLDHQFQRQLNKTQIETFCGRCTDFYIFVFALKKCLRLITDNCLIGYSQDVLEYGKNELSTSDILIDENHEIYVSKINCLIDAENQSICSQIPNCIMCQYSNFYQQIICLQCSQGNYLDRFSFKCHKCQNQCMICHQENKYLKDSWKLQMLSFYLEFIQPYNNQNLFGQPEISNQADYELVCDECYSPQILFRNNCIFQCILGCEKCDLIGKENICFECKKGLTLLRDHSCTDCKSSINNCNICNLKSNKEIEQLKPGFQLLWPPFIEIPYFCLKPRGDNLFYDSQINQFVKCEIFQDGCEKQLVIKLMLICQLMENNKFRFKIEKFSEVLQYASYNQVQKIILVYESMIPITCQYQTETVFNIGLFEQLLFLKETELVINCFHEVVWEIEKNFSFEMFSKITINGLIFKIQSTIFPKILSFQSQLQQKIIFNNVQFFQESQNLINFQISFKNTLFLSFFNTTFVNFQIQKGVALISVDEASKNQIIQFQNSNFTNFQLYNSFLIQILGETNDKLIFHQIQFIDSKINNGSLIIRQIQQYGESELINVTFLNIVIKNSPTFFNLQSFKQSIINNFDIVQVNLINSNLISLSQIHVVTNLTIQLCILEQKSIMIQNVEYQGNESLTFYNLIITFNNYSRFSKILSLNRYRQLNSELYIQNLTYQSNYLESKDIDINLMDINSSVILLEFDKISITNILIYRDKGLNELTFYNVQELRIMNGLITQSLQNKILGIDSFFECFSKTAQNNFYGISIFLSSIHSAFISNLKIHQVQIYDYPIIYFISDDFGINNDKEQLVLSQITLENSLFVQKILQTKSSFILIESNQWLEIIIDNSNFDSNILKTYSSDTLINSAIIFNINAKYSKISIQYCQFQKNLAIDSKAGLLYVRSNSIVMQNCSIYQNNVFIYEVIRPYLIWTFDESQQIYLEQIQELINIQSQFGLGYFISEQVSITQSIFEVYQCSEAYLYLIIEGEGNIYCNFLNVFSNNTFPDLYTRGSVIKIDSTTSSGVILSIFNLQAQQIYANTNGGIVQIITGEGNVKITFANINITDIYADLGSFLYFENIGYKKKQQTINLENITSLTSQFGKEIFMNKIFHYSQNSRIPNWTLESNRTLIYIFKSSQVKFYNLNFYGLFFQTAVVIKETNYIQFVAFFISECYFNERIIFISPDESSQAQIVLDNIKIINTKFGQIKTYDLQPFIILPMKLHQKCDSITNSLPPNILPSLRNNSWPKIENSFQNMIDSPQTQKYGAIHFSQLNEFHLLRFENIQLENIICLYCSSGLVYINFNNIKQNLKKQTFTNLIVTNSYCGFKGCFYFSTSSSNKVANTQNLLQNIEVVIQNYICQFNIAVNGTCLFLENIIVLIQKSNFRWNNATLSGGTIFSKQSSQNNQLIIENTVIQNNFAQVGGGIFLDGQQELNFDQLDSIVSGNEAQLFANDISAIPSRLQISIGHIQSNQFEILTIKSNNTYMLQIQKLKTQTLQFGLIKSFLLLPNGCPISQYQYFDWRNRNYTPLNLTIRILAFTSSGQVIKNLKDSYCKIKSRIVQLLNGNEIEMSIDNYTSFSSLNFDEETQNYNLDNLSIYKREDIYDEEILELEFWCSSIFVPIYNKNYPYNLLSQHNEYFLKLQIKTYPCQLGEITNATFKQCQTCKSSEGFFQLKLNQTYCLLRDEVSTIEVQPAMLNLRVGYWRPYFDTSLISECQNFPSNCQGGWIEGDNSCSSGHIGALCEQCDLYNIRGDGQFSQQQQYGCLKCQNNTGEYYYYALNLFLTFISIAISASGNIQSVNERVQVLRLQNMGFKISYNQNSKVLQFKILVYYLQVLNSIYTLQVDFILPLWNRIYANQTTLPNFLDCLLSQIETIEIQYLRIIWSLIIPFAYFCLFYWIYGIILLIKKQPFNVSFISTTLLYLYIYFSPTLAGDLVRMVSYRFISGYYWISSNVAYRYDNYKHIYWMLYLGAPSLIILTFIIPAYLFKVLYQNRLKLDQKSIRQLLGFLYNEFKTSAYFWEVIKIELKISLNFFLTFYYEESSIKSGISLLILIFYQFLSLEYQPYLTKQYNKLDQTANQIILLSISLSQGIVLGQQNDLRYFQLFFEIILIIINFNFLIKLTFSIAASYLVEYKNFYYNLHDKFTSILLGYVPSLNNNKFLKKFFKNYKQEQIQIQNLWSKLKKYSRQQGKIRVHQKSIEK